MTMMIMMMMIPSCLGILALSHTAQCKADPPLAPFNNNDNDDNANDDCTFGPKYWMTIIIT